MLESLIITLREGVEAALVVAIVLAYLRKVGRMDLARGVWVGLGCAVVGSVIGAILLSRALVGEEAFEGWIMLAAAISLATMVWWMARTARALKGEIEGRVSAFTTQSSTAALWAIGLFVFLMVAREGAETVLLFSAVRLTSTDISSAIGALLGLAGAIAFGVMFVNGTMKVDLARFFRVTSVILFVVAAQLLLGALHELSEGLIIPSSKREMEIIGPLVNNSAVTFVLILALTAMLFLMGSRRAHTEDAGAANAAERRLAEARARRDARWRRAGALAACAIAVAIAANYIYTRNANALSPATPVTLQGDAVRIPLAHIADGHLHRFVYDSKGVPVRFIVVQAAPGNIRTAFDACQICGNDGYVEKAPHVICVTCASPILIPTIGDEGGCNPRHLDSRIDGDAVLIPRAALDGGRQWFE